MSVSALGSSQSDSLAQLYKQRRDALKSMMDAVQQGDMAAAQTNAATIQSDNTQIASATGASGSSDSSGSSDPFRTTMKNDLSALMQAVQSGDLANSQSALNQLNSDASAMQPQMPSFLADIAGASSSDQNTFLNDLNALVNAVSSGDSAGAKSAATAVQTDMQTIFGTQATGDSDGDGDGSSAAAGSGSSAQGNFLTDLNTLISSAQSGDMTTAQNTVGKLGTDLQGAFQGVGGAHHHHHDADMDADDSATDPTQTTTAASTDPTTAADAGSPYGLGQINDRALQEVMDAYAMMTDVSGASA
jgi:hypothetical protein